LKEASDLKDMKDIREGTAYRAFVKSIKGITNINENGYEILSKTYKQEIKYTAGNLMQLHLRGLVDQSIETFLNFFKGIPTLT
jgi:hypothetical protein